MSKIVLSCGKEWLKAENLKILKEVTTLGFAEIRKRIENDEFVAEFPLFLNDHKEVEDRLKNLIAVAEKKDLKFGLFEIDETENFTGIEDTKIFEISTQTLRSIFESRKEIIKQIDDEDALRFG